MHINSFKYVRQNRQISFSCKELCLFYDGNLKGTRGKWAAGFSTSLMQSTLLSRMLFLWSWPYSNLSILIFCQWWISSSILTGWILWIWFSGIISHCCVYAEKFSVSSCTVLLISTDGKILLLEPIIHFQCISSKALYKKVICYVTWSFCMSFLSDMINGWEGLQELVISIKSSNACWKASALCQLSSGLCCICVSCDYIPFKYTRWHARGLSKQTPIGSHRPWNQYFKEKGKMLKVTRCQEFLRGGSTSGLRQSLLVYCAFGCKGKKIVFSRNEIYMMMSIKCSWKAHVS